MQFLTKHDVYQDRATGAYYEKCFSLKPVALIDCLDKCDTKGVLLRPFSESPDLDLDQYNSTRATYHCRERFGFDVGDLGQDVFVTRDMLDRRFLHVGLIYVPVDLTASLRDYEEENCDFRNRQWVLRQLERYITQQTVGSLSDCVIYTAYLDYAARTPKTPQHQTQLSLFPD